MTTNEIDHLKRFFDSKFIHISNYWLECCLEWFKGQHNNYTEEYMFSVILQQWLDADIRDIEVRCLPPNLTQAPKTQLTGNYTVQVMYFKNIAVSSLSQLKKIRDMYKLTRSIPDEGPELNQSGKRMLHLHMTDGVQFINGFEEKSIPCLNINMPPGVKILLIGPLEVRYGEVFLQSKNVKILGGEVEDLAICNAVENVVARELKMDENPNPGKIKLETENMTENNTHINQNSVNINSNSTNLVKNNNTRQLNQNNMQNIATRNASIPTSSIRNNSVSNNTISNQKQTNQNYSEIFAADDEEEMMLANLELEENIPTDINQTLNFEDDVFDNIDITAELNKNISNTSVSKKAHTVTFDSIDDQQLLNVDEVDKDSDKTQELFSEDFDFYNELELIDNANELKSDNVPVVQNPEPFVYIKHLIDNRQAIKNKKIRVKARFRNCVEKLRINKNTNQFTMKFDITDGTGNMTVNFSHEVIQSLSDLTVEEIRSKPKIEVQLVKLHEKLHRFKGVLRSIDSIIELQFTEDVEHPQIIFIETKNCDYIELLKQRVKNANVKIL